VFGFHLSPSFLLSHFLIYFRSFYELVAAALQLFQLGAVLFSNRCNVTERRVTCVKRQQLQGAGSPQFPLHCFIFWLPPFTISMRK
jgi:hypothetical protein